MDPVLATYLGDWLHLLVRWLHVTAAIAWVGASFYFIALDHSLRPPAGTERPAIGGEAWEIHGGGFYRIEKFRVAPPSLPEALRWFKWEAYLTWLSGFSLLVLLYYLNATTYLIDPLVLALEPWQTRQALAHRPRNRRQMINAPLTRNPVRRLSNRFLTPPRLL